MPRCDESAIGSRARSAGSFPRANRNLQIVPGRPARQECSQGCSAVRCVGGDGLNRGPLSVPGPGSPGNPGSVAGQAIVPAGLPPVRPDQLKVSAMPPTAKSSLSPMKALSLVNANSLGHAAITQTHDRLPLSDAVPCSRNARWHGSAWQGQPSAHRTAGQEGPASHSGPANRVGQGRAGAGGRPADARGRAAGLGCRRGGIKAGRRCRAVAGNAGRHAMRRRARGYPLTGTRRQRHGQQ